MIGPRLRLGIDVGGTFTDVVAIDAQTRSLVASVKVPTTHDAPEGVAAGIVDGIERLLARANIDPANVAFIAHSTTQATNALLEGDVARIGVLGLVDRLSPLAQMQMRFPRLDLAPGVPFDVEFAFVRSNGPRERDRAIEAFRSHGIDAVAVSQAFSVDDARAENAACEAVRAQELFATSGHEVSSMYGLRARTRTAALNAAILPRMVRTARMTASAVQRAAIPAPLMVMRSDGGVMDVREMERRPILTLLSGPAAGVAGALLHENVTDGIFIEVGGTSADCSAIRAGMPQMRPARVGGHRTMLRTLDVRTLAIAGGSMIRANDRTIVDVGPRSAHIAGLKYASFADERLLEGATVERLRPSPHDPADYVALRAQDGTGIALTTTCAANVLGYVPEGAFAKGNAAAARRGFELLAASISTDAESLARSVLELASAKVIAAIEELIADYELDRETLVVIGGGGGAAALVPYAAQRTGIDFRLARDAEVISPIGVALALVREVVERTIVDPSPDDIVRIRREAQDAVVLAGAAPERIEVAVEIDAQRNLVRATASGATELAQSAGTHVAEAGDLRAAAARLFRDEAGRVRSIALTNGLEVFERERVRLGKFGRRSATRDVRVLDRLGVGRLALRDAGVRQTDASHALELLPQVVEGATAFGDVGRALPDIYVLHGARIADFSGLASAEQAVALAREELAGREPDAPVVILTASKPA
ncbi:MAG TPA: hydantoinase/oxoprolinase family protein [Candidatus Baltobacteraceae bacterium]|nr:hydantoinase/oxoprolinase family protein [Candidatus Baltobacteraceae bacterium]